MMERGKLDRGIMELVDLEGLVPSEHLLYTDREAHGKAPFDDDDREPPKSGKKRDNTSKKKQARRKNEKTHTVTRSVTDPESGLFVKGEHKREFAYEAHTACDRNGFVLEVVTPGNVHDSVAFDKVYGKVTTAFPQVETIVADSAPYIVSKPGFSSRESGFFDRLRPLPMEAV